MLPRPIVLKWAVRANSLVSSEENNVYRKRETWHYENGFHQSLASVWAVPVYNGTLNRGGTSQLRRGCGWKQWKNKFPAHCKECCLVNNYIQCKNIRNESRICGIYSRVPNNRLSRLSILWIFPPPPPLLSLENLILVLRESVHSSAQKSRNCVQKYKEQFKQADCIWIYALIWNAYFNNLCLLLSIPFIFPPSFYQFSKHFPSPRLLPLPPPDYSLLKSTLFRE